MRYEGKNRCDPEEKIAHHKLFFSLQISKKFNVQATGVTCHPWWPEVILEDICYMSHVSALMKGRMHHCVKFGVIEKLDVMTQKVLSFSLVRDLEEVWVYEQ